MVVHRPLTDLLIRFNLVRWGHYLRWQQVT